MKSEKVLVIQRAVGARLRAHRTARHLSGRQVEEMSAGAVRDVALVSYERGDRALTVARLVEIAELYGVPAAEFLPDRHRFTSETPLVRASLLREIAAELTAEAAMLAGDGVEADVEADVEAAVEVAP